MVLLTIGLFVAHGAAAQTALPSARCAGPLSWRLGDLDARFGVSREHVARLATAAAERWNRAAGRDLLVEDERARFTVSFRYGVRQRVGRAVDSVADEAFRRSTRIDGMKAALATLRKQVEQTAASVRLEQRSAIEATAVFASDLKAFRAEGARGAGARATAARLEARRLALRERMDALAAREDSLARMVDDLETLRKAVNDRIELHNRMTRNAKRVVDALPEETRRLGTTHIDGPRSRIVLHQFSDLETLWTVLLHEFGHALGLLHLVQADAIMHATRSEATATDLTAADIRAIRALCPAR